MINDNYSLGCCHCHCATLHTIGIDTRASSALPTHLLGVAKSWLSKGHNRERKNLKLMAI